MSKVVVPCSWTAAWKERFVRGVLDFWHHCAVGKSRITTTKHIFSSQHSLILMSRITMRVNLSSTPPFWIIITTTTTTTTITMIIQGQCLWCYHHGKSVHPVHVVSANSAPGGRQPSDQANQHGLWVRITSQLVPRSSRTAVKSYPRLGQLVPILIATRSALHLLVMSVV